MSFSLEPIGIIHSPFKEKFGIPRQPGLVPEASATLELLSPYNRPEAVGGLEGFSHIWLTFVFHGIEANDWRPTVRPPRLGGNQRIGVFASRSPYRPNGLGLSVLKLDRVILTKDLVGLQLSGVDLLDGTPVLDIKPYLPYADSIPDAAAGYAADAPLPRLRVRFSEEAEQQLAALGNSREICALLKGLLAQDPRPAYRDSDSSERTFGMRLYDFDVKWRVTGAEVEVIGLSKGPV